MALNAQGQGQPTLTEDAIGQAMNALLAYVKESGNGDDLLESTAETVVTLVIGLKKRPGEPRMTPIRLELPHTLYGREDSQVCVITRTEDAEKWEEKRKDGHLPGVSRVVSMTELRKDYGRFAYRRELLAAHDLFLADRAVIPMLARALGKTFFAKKKHPVPVHMTAADIKDAQESTYMFLSGDCLNIKLGTVALSKQELVENAVAVVKQAVSRIPRKWSNVASIHIKTPTSVSLPLYVASLHTMAVEEEPKTKATRKQPRRATRSSTRRVKA